LGQRFLLTRTGRKNDAQTVPEIENFIKEKLTEHSSQVIQEDQDDLEDIQYEEEEEDIQHEDDDNVDNFIKYMKEYTKNVLQMQQNSPEDDRMLKAMTAMTKTLKKSLKCNPHTLQQQLHTFGKGTAAARATKSGRIIYPNPPAIAARLAGGRNPAPLGRPPLPRSGQTVTVDTGSGAEVVAMSDNPPRHQSRRPHDFSQVVDRNLPGARF
jgi:hypothetical protein